jgi:L-threonylcarbamoyladenylate synthase
LESTVISFNPDDSINILRSGFITREDLAGFKICDNVIISEKSLDFINPPSPGMKYKHYSPDAPLYILSGEEHDIINFIKSEMKTKKAGFLCYDEMSEYFENNKNIITIGSKNDLKEQARNLFDALNRFNSLDAEIIYAAEPEKVKLGEAVYDRLIKAAGGKIIKI